MDIGNGGGLVQQHAVFVVEIQAAVVKIGGADHGGVVIAKAHFGVDEAGLVFVNLNAAFD